MNKIIKTEDIENLIIEIDGNKVILDVYVAKLYGVETKRINEAVKNNPDKFPEGYIIQISKNEWNLLKSKIPASNKSKKTSSVKVVENFDHLEKLKYSPYLPKAFTEKGLYMLATILKSKAATMTTISIIETFAKIRELTGNIKKLSEIQNKREKNKVLRKSGEIISEILEDDMKISDTETSIEINFAILKFKHTIKRKKTNN
jgi:hypothetical protein